MRLIHFTLRECFSAHPDILNRPHSAMAEICLTYLNSQHVKALSADSFDDLPTLTHENPFLEYCSLYWGVHAKKELSNLATSLALQLFKEYNGHISLAVFADKTWDTRSVDTKDSLWSGLHYASFFGIVEVVPLR